jgi:hypothetical protein
LALLPMLCAVQRVGALTRRRSFTRSAGAPQLWCVPSAAVHDPKDWAFVKMPDAPIEMLYHKRGFGYKTFLALAGRKK